MKIITWWMRRNCDFNQKPPLFYYPKVEAWMLKEVPAHAMWWEPQGLLIEGTILIQPHKGSKVTWFITYKFQKWGRGCNEPWEGRSSIPGHKWGGGNKSRVSSTYYLQGVGKNSLTLGAQLLSGYLKGTPGKAKWELMVGILSSSSYLILFRLWVWIGLPYCKMPSQQL